MQFRTKQCIWSYFLVFLAEQQIVSLYYTGSGSGTRLLTRGGHMMLHIQRLMRRKKEQQSISSRPSRKSRLYSESAALPPRRLLLHLACTRSQRQGLERLGDEALRGRDAQHQQQLGVATWWTRRRRRKKE